MGKINSPNFKIKPSIHIYNTFLLESYILYIYIKHENDNVYRNHGSFLCHLVTGITTYKPNKKKKCKFMGAAT